VALEQIWVRAGSELIPVVLHPVASPPEGYLSLQYRIIGSGSLRGEESPTTFCLKIPRREREQIAVPEHESDVAEEAARGGMVEVGIRLPPNLTWPYNTGVMCRVRNVSEMEPRHSRTFSEIYGSLNMKHRVWLCPMHKLLQMGSPNPRKDPLRTSSLYYKPWIWEGCIPYIIDAARHPEKYAFQNRRSLGIAFPRTTELGAETWQITKTLVEKSFERAAAGGFDAGGEWISYTCEKAPPKALTVKQAGEVLQIYSSRPSLEKIDFIETQYFKLYEQNDPAKVDMETNPELWRQRDEYVKYLTSAYQRLILERLLSCRSISAYNSRENAIAASILSMIVWLDTSKMHQGFIRVVYRKDAAERYQLKRGTLEYQYDQDGNLIPYRVKDTIEFWVRKLYIEPYKQDYDFDVTVEGLPEEW
jgi:hypothetical protein